MRFSLALRSLSEATKAAYAVDTNDVPLLNEGILATARHLAASQTLLEDEARAWQTGVLEDLKRQRDCLVSMRELFDRRDRYAKDNIPQLEKRIEANERKLQELRARPPGAVKPGEIEKVEEAIVKVSPPAVPLPGYHVFSDALFLGQGIYRTATRSRRFHQADHPRGTLPFPAEPVPHQPPSSGLEPGARQVRRAAGG